MLSRAPEYAGRSKLPPPQDPRTLAALGGEPAPQPESHALAVPEPLRDGNYRFAADGLELVLDPSGPGQLVRVALDGKALLVPPENLGGYRSAKVEGDALVLERHSSSGLLELHRYRLDVTRRAFEASHTVRSVDGYAPPVSSVGQANFAGGGITFFPNARAVHPNATPVVGSTVWLTHDSKLSGDYYVDGAEGWVAELDGSLLLVRVFIEQGGANRDRPEQDIHLSASFEARRGVASIQTELASQPLATRGEVTFRERWLVRPLPSGIDAKSGNRELVAFVRGVIQ